MIENRLMQLYVLMIMVLSFVCLVYVYAFPPSSMLINRDGVAHFSPPVAHPETGEAIDLGELIKHFRGD